MVNNIRRVIVMVLGLVLIVDALMANRLPVVQFTVGMILLGLVPVDVVVDAINAHCHPYSEP
jgi:predicted membrane GTPase involved in stress response